jgi:hypothetical protein
MERRWNTAVRDHGARELRWVSDGGGRVSERVVEERRGSCATDCEGGQGRSCRASIEGRQYREGTRG